MTENQSYDPQETQEWLDALDAVVEHDGIERAHAIIEALIDKARRAGANLPFKATTAYVNTIHLSPGRTRSSSRAGCAAPTRSAASWMPASR